MMPHIAPIDFTPPARTLEAFFIHPFSNCYTADMRKLFESLSYAVIGIRVAWREGSNFKVALACAAAAVGAGAFLHISAIEYALVLLVIAFVLTAEIFNTALEELCDKFQPTHDPHIAKIKDLSAAAVLLSSIGAFVIGLIIFLPYLW